ncbi:hypothetical protein LWS69_01140 [Bordetella hinzii]|nr:hypothetical protein [Bordetella hinzii]
MSSYKDRQPMLAEIEQQRESKVISYITGDRRHLETQISPEVIDLFVDHLDAIGPVPRLSLILHTNGGDTSAAWRLVNLLHTFCDELEVIIPSKALSAGTLISLGADKIVMSKQAALGPIDPSLNHPLNPVIPFSPNITFPVSVEAVRGYLDATKDFGIEDPHVLGDILKDLANKVHPLVLGQIFRSRSQIRFLAHKLLQRQVKEEGKIKEIADFLCAESGSHDYTINRREARALGLQIEQPSTEFYGIIRRFIQSYVEEMELLNPYDPYSMMGLSQTFPYAISRGAIESVASGSHQFFSEGILTKSVTQQMGPQGPFQQESINDNRRFEGWRKVS